MPKAKEFSLNAQHQPLFSNTNMVPEFTAATFRATIQRLGIKQKALAEAIGEPRGSVEKWLKEMEPLPGAVITLLRLLDSSKEVRRSRGVVPNPRSAGRTPTKGSKKVYGFNVAASARRHWDAAEKLYNSSKPGELAGNRAVAGYLYGLAGELAVKQMMRDSVMRPLIPEARADDPFYKHFPHLKMLLLNCAKGYRSSELRKLAEDLQLFQSWDTSMRYAPNSDIKPEWVEAWRNSAKDLVGKMNLG